MIKTKNVIEIEYHSIKNGIKTKLFILEKKKLQKRNYKKKKKNKKE